MFSYPSLFSFCWPLAKEHTRRNRQSRTFLVENVIGEIWSELEEGSILKRPLPLLYCVCVCGGGAAGKNAFLFVPFVLLENVPDQLVLQTTHPGRALFGAVILHVLKPYRFFRRKVGIGTHQFQSESCAKQQVI